MHDYNCGKCGGLVPEPMKSYGYGGRFCHCDNPTPQRQTITISGYTIETLQDNK